MNFHELFYTLLTIYRRNIYSFIKNIEKNKTNKIKDVYFIFHFSKIKEKIPSYA